MIVKSLFTEYGLKWTLNRGLYSAKLKMISSIPATESFFEKSVSVQKIDIFDFDITSIKDFLKGLSQGEKSEIISIADNALDGIINGFSSIELNYGNPINWHLNPLTGMECRNDVKWHEIPDFDERLGDIKVIWEASRLTHFFYLVRAYLLTEDKKYYDAFSTQLEDWLENNPYPYGANFKCGQECTLRMINGLWAYNVFRNCGVTSENDSLNIRELVEVNYKKVISNFFYAHKCIKNNHTFSEICGLIVGAWCSNDREGVKKAYKLFDREIKSQFTQDGGFTQYSFNYHRFTLQVIECVYKLSEKTGEYITEVDRVKNSINLLYQLQNSNGDVPNYGSNDGALIFPLTSCCYRDFRPVLNTVYGIIEGKRLYEYGNYDEELIWFANRVDFPFEEIERKTSFFNDSGFYSLRHKQGFLMTCLQDYKSRPAHMDQLHIDLWHNGVNVLCDSGTYSYASNLGKNLSSTSGHNTVKIDNTEQMNKVGAFLVTDWSKRKKLKYDNSNFEGSLVSMNGYEHTRKIVKTDSGYQITDKIYGDEAHCELYFHTPCEVKIVPDGFELINENRKIAKIYIDYPAKVTTTYRSLYYLKKDEINCVTVKMDMKNKKCNIKYFIELNK